MSELSMRFNRPTSVRLELFPINRSNTIHGKQTGSDSRTESGNRGPKVEPESGKSGQLILNYPIGEQTIPSRRIELDLPCLSPSEPVAKCQGCL